MGIIAECFIIGEQNPRHKHTDSKNGKQYTQNYKRCIFHNSCFSVMNQEFPNTHAQPNVLYYLNSISQTIFITRILLTISNKSHLVFARLEGDYPFEKIPIHRHGFLDVRSRDCRDVLAVPAYNCLLSADRLLLGPQFGPFASAIRRIGKIQAIHRGAISEEKHHEPRTHLRKGIW